MCIWPRPSLVILAQQGYLRALPLSHQQLHAFSRNKQQQQRLMAQPNGFLRDYDLLFRQVTAGLIRHNYEFSEIHPHQTLKKLLLLLVQDFSEAELEQLIQCRHSMKYGYVDQASPLALTMLGQLLVVTSSAHVL